MHASVSIKRALVHLAIVFGVSLFALPAAHAQEKVRPEVGKPLQQAQDMLKAKRYKEALGKLKEADGVSGKTANEWGCGSYRCQESQAVLRPVLDIF